MNICTEEWTTQVYNMFPLYTKRQFITEYNKNLRINEDARIMNINEEEPMKI